MNTNEALGCPRFALPVSPGVSIEVDSHTLPEATKKKKGKSHKSFLKCFSQTTQNALVGIWCPENEESSQMSGGGENRKMDTKKKI